MVKKTLPIISLAAILTTVIWFDDYLRTPANSLPIYKWWFAALRSLSYTISESVFDYIGGVFIFLVPLDIVLGSRVTIMLIDGLSYIKKATIDSFIPIDPWHNGEIYIIISSWAGHLFFTSVLMCSISMLILSNLSIKKLLIMTAIILIILPMFTIVYIPIVLIGFYLQHVDPKNIYKRTRLTLSFVIVSPLFCVLGVKILSRVLA